MTTAAEIRQLAEAGAAEAHRVIFLASSVLTSSSGIDSFAREVAALANREGGRVVLGVSSGGKFEEAPALSREAADEAIREALERRIEPPVRAVVEHIADERGEATVVRMLPRSGPPHRAPAPDGSAERTVYVRLGDRTRAATGEQVEWMERVQRDPAVERSWTIAASRLVGDPVGDASCPIAGIYRQMLERAPESVRDEIERDPVARLKASVELASWAFLLGVDRAMAERDDAAVVSLDDLAQPGTRSMIGAIPGGVAALLGAPASGGLLSRLFGRAGARHEFRVPPGAEPQVDLLLHQRKGRVMLVHPGWVVTFAATADGDADGPEASELRLELACSLVFPERDGQVAAQREAERIARMVERDWCAPGA